MAIAYLALCALHDLDAEAETGSIRQARLELHRRLDPNAGDDDQPRRDEGRPPLYVVR